MADINQSPLYNLNAVLKKTNLKADVLRAWERRYGLPQPQRTPGGHRLYSEYDIETVKWLKARQKDGLSISRAVDLWREVVQEGRDPLAEFFTEAALSDTLIPSSDTCIEMMRSHWLDACMEFDTERAENILNQAFAMYPVETVCTAILQENISILGEYWFLGKASAQQEHFASALAVRRLEALITAAPHPMREQTVLVGCPAGEWHTFSALLLNLFLLRKGFKVIYLGANIPLEQMHETAASILPDLVILTAQQLTTAATLQSTAFSLKNQGIKLAYGGLVFNRIPALRKQIPAHFLGETLEKAIPQIEQLVISPISHTITDDVDNAYKASASIYRKKRAMIEFKLLETLQKNGLIFDYLHEVNAHFGDSLTAALELGNPAYLEADMKWVNRLLANRNITTDALIPYLLAYRNTVHSELGNEAISIISWIDSYTADKRTENQ